MLGDVRFSYKEALKASCRVDEDILFSASPQCGCTRGTGQSHFDFSMRTGTALKGHGFSRAETRCKKRTGLGRWGMLSERKPLPQNLNAEDIHQDLSTARLKPCPFKTQSFHSLKCNSPDARQQNRCLRNGQPTTSHHPSGSRQSGSPRLKSWRKSLAARRHPRQRSKPDSSFLQARWRKRG